MSMGIPCHTDGHEYEPPREVIPIIAGLAGYATSAVSGPAAPIAAPIVSAGVKKILEKQKGGDCSCK